MVITQPSHSNTGLFSPVFRCNLNTRPFENRTTFDQLNTGLVRYSNGYCIPYCSNSENTTSILFKPSSQHQNKHFNSCAFDLFHNLGAKRKREQQMEIKDIA